MRIWLCHSPIAQDQNNLQVYMFYGYRSNAEFLINLHKLSLIYINYDYFPLFQVYMFYGYRSNAEFLIHNGFVMDDNHNDKVGVKLGKTQMKF